MVIILVSKVETWSTVVSDLDPPLKVRKFALFQREGGPGLHELLANAKACVGTYLIPRTPSALELVTSSALQYKIEFELFMGSDNSWGFLSRCFPATHSLPRGRIKEVFAFPFFSGFDFLLSLCVSEDFKTSKQIKYYSSSLLRLALLWCFPPFSG